MIVLKVLFANMKAWWIFCFILCPDLYILQLTTSHLENVIASVVHIVENLALDITVFFWHSFITEKVSGLQKVKKEVLGLCVPWIK